MSKIELIIQREYTTRVMKKSFIVITFLTPLIFAGMIVVPLWLAQMKDNSQKHIYVIDQTGIYRNILKNNNIYNFTYVDDSPEEVRKQKTRDKDFTALLVIRADLSKNEKAATIYSNEQVNLELKTYLASVLNKYVEEKKLAAYNIPNLKKLVDDSHTNIDITTIKWDKNGKAKEGSAELALIVGFVTAMLIYLFIVIYGAQVMNGVVQEKTNRIVEVIVSSVKPFELMMGKIIGIALVGLTQFLLWVILTGAISSIAFLFVADSVNPETLAQINTGVHPISTVQPDNLSLNQLFTILSNFNFGQILGLFIVYFLGGYLLYASLFAAVGSAVDNETDTQQFSLPLTLPIVFAIYAAIYSVQNPDGPLSFWCSMIPFTSPVVMMVRLPYGVPLWQIALSLSVLIGSFVATTWMAGKIYRTGILMYGKKSSWKEMWKWLRY